MIINRFLQPVDTMKRVTREDFCDRMDEILETINKEKVGIVIAKDGEPDLVACPAAWFELIYDDDFGCIINSAIRYSLGRESYMPSVAVNFVLKYIMVLDTKTMTVMLRDIKQALEDAKLPYREIWVSLMYALEDRLNKIQEKGGN